MASQGEVAYGRHVVALLLERRPKQVQALYCTGDAPADTPPAERSTWQAHAQALNVPVTVVGREALDQLTSGGVHQGVAARVLPFAYAPMQALTAGPAAPLILVLDQIQDPQNFGALVRSAAAFGASGVLVPQDRAAPMSGVAIKASAGAAYVVPVVQAKNLRRGLDQLAAQGVWRCGLAADASQLVRSVDWRLPFAIVVGAEGHGLRRLTRERCDLLARVPASGMESLNAAIAGSIVLYEAAASRQQA